MAKKLCLVLLVILTAAGLLAACTPATPTEPAATALQPTIIPAANAAATPAVLAGALASKAGLVTDTGGVKDHAFNQLAWEGMQKAAKEMGFEVKYLESQQPGDYEKNIDAFAAEGYQVIITIGSQMSDATVLKAKQYPDIKFGIVDYASSINSLANLTSLMFAEDQAGFLAGVLAGGMSKSGFVCSISSVLTPSSERYMKSFFAGATWQAGPKMKFMNNYINIKTTNKDIPTFADSTQGKQSALRLMGQGCDVIFSVGGDSVNGVLLAAREKNLPAIGADVDPYITNPEAQPALVSSATKNVDIAVYTYLKAVADGSVKAGISTATLQTGGVGLAPFHDWDSKIPAALKAQILKASDGIKNGSIKTQ